MTLNEWAQYITQVREKKGFKTSKENALEKLMLVITELDEADDAFGQENADNFYEELADAQIRILDLAAACAINIELELEKFLGRSAYDFQGLADEYGRLVKDHLDPEADSEILKMRLFAAVKHLSKAAEAVRRQQDDEFAKYLARACWVIAGMAMACKNDHEAEIQKKMKVNEGRPYLHEKIA